MTRLNERLGKLEAANGTGANRASAFVFLALTADDEPADDMPKMIWVTGADEQFLRDDYGSDSAFLAAAAECHQRIHGQPLDWDGSTQA